MKIEPPQGIDNQAELGRCQSIDWYAEGEARVIECNGVRVVVRFVGRKGRRGRIAISAPAGAVFRAEEPGPDER